MNEMVLVLSGGGGGGATFLACEMCRRPKCVCCACESFMNE
jgi:hypothetical protein